MPSATRDAAAHRADVVAECLVSVIVLAV